MQVNWVKIAYEQGYRVVDGVVYSRRGKVAKPQISNGYARFTLRVPVRYSPDRPRRVARVPVHRLVAYQKYGDKALMKGMVVRHIDSDPSNNLPDNILIGTPSQNMMDKPAKVRYEQSIHAALHQRIWDDELILAIKQDRRLGLTYRQLAEKYGLNNKRQARHISRHYYSTLGRFPTDISHESSIEIGNLFS